MQKGQALIFLLVSIVVIAVASGAYLLGRQTTSKSSPTQISSSTPSPTDETTNWQTYTDNNLHISFKYPSDFQIPDEETTKFTRVSPDYILIFDTQINLNPTTGKPYKDINYDYLKFNYPLKTKVVGGQEVVQTLPRAGGENKAAVSFFSKDKDYIFNLELETRSNKMEANQKLFDQILATFKFINQTGTDETANWKTYTNMLEGFSMKYPENWELKNPSGPSDPTTVTFKGPILGESNIPEPVRPSVWVIIGGPGNANTVSEVVDNSILQMRSQDPNFKLSYRERIKIDGVDAEWTTGFPSRSGTVLVYVLKNSKLYQFFFDPYDPNIKEWKSTEYADIFKKMLSTVKFTQ